MCGEVLGCAVESWDLGKRLGLAGRQSGFTLGRRRASRALMLQVRDSSGGRGGRGEVSLCTGYSMPTFGNMVVRGRVTLTALIDAGASGLGFLYRALNTCLREVVFREIYKRDFKG